MCLAIPAKIVSIEGDRAIVEALGNRWTARTTLLEHVSVGDIVLVHAGFAICTVDPKQAMETWELFSAMLNATDMDKEHGDGK